jgi:predicted DCC family thiol-disulfide oxidoreductase YuxK
MDVTPRKIVFYDGDCGLCQFSVQFVLKYEKTNNIYFSSLQSKFSAVFFKSHGLDVSDYSSFYFYEQGQLYTKSRAVLKVLRRLRFPFPLFRLFLFVPKGIGDFLYDCIARRRSSFLKAHCLILSEQNKHRFLY